MRRLLWIMVGLMLLPMMSLAIWQVADPSHGARYQFLNTTHLLQADYPKKYANGSKFLFKLRKGLLQDNVRRLAGKYNWKVVWKAPNSYYVTLNTEIVGATFPITMNRLLAHYPLRATYDARNKRMKVYRR